MVTDAIDLASLLHTLSPRDSLRRRATDGGDTMWNKDKEQAGRPAAESRPQVSAPSATTASPATATIGPSIIIRGDVTGSEDLLIQGQVDGSVTLDQHAVSVGSEGRVNANIVGRVITIEGKVEGDLTAQEQIVLRGSAHVQGDIKAPRVVLEDGATFRGLVDMGARSTGDDAESADTAASGASAVRVEDEPMSKSETEPSPTPPGSARESHRSKGSPSSSVRPTSRKGKDASSRVDQARA